MAVYSSYEGYFEPLLLSPEGHDFEQRVVAAFPFMKL
jgi:hypothetical protein